MAIPQLPFRVLSIFDPGRPDGKGFTLVGSHLNFHPQVTL